VQGVHEGLAGSRYWLCNRAGLEVGNGSYRIENISSFTQWKGEVILFCSQIPTQSQILQSGVRQFLHRMVVCLEEELLPYIPQASEGLLKGNDIRSIQEYIPLIVQIIAKFKVS
jgi:hypothetical protein